MSCQQKELAFHLEQCQRPLDLRKIQYFLFKLCICPSCRQFMIRIYYSYEVSIFFLPLSSRYLELPSIHACSSHFRQAIEYSQVEESSFYKVDVQVFCSRILETPTVSQIDACTNNFTIPYRTVGTNPQSRSASHRAKQESTDQKGPNNKIKDSSHKAKRERTHQRNPANQRSG